MWRLTPPEGVQPAPELPGITNPPPLTGSGVPNFLRLLARSPASVNAYLQARDALANGRLTPQQREEIALAVAAINGSDYCLTAHALAGRQAGLSDEEIDLAQKASAKNPKTEAMLHFVQAIVLQRGEVSDRDFSAVRSAGFSEGEIIEVLANVGLNIFMNYFNLLAQTDPDQIPCPV